MLTQDTEYAVSQNNEFLAIGFLQFLPADGIAVAIVEFVAVAVRFAIPCILLSDEIPVPVLLWLSEYISFALDSLDSHGVRIGHE